MSDKKDRYNLEEIKKLITEQLCTCDDIQLVILKGHILIEYLLNHIIDIRANEDIEFEKSKFSFSQKLYLYRLLCNNSTELYNDINLLNKLRNEIAHKLTYSVNYLTALISSVERRYDFITESKKKYSMVIDKTKIPINILHDTEVQKKAHDLFLVIVTLAYICGSLSSQIKQQSIKKTIIKDLSKSK